MKILNKKGQALQNMPGEVLTFVVVVIVLAVGGLVVAGVQDTLTANTTEFNVTADGLEGIKKFSAFLPTIAVVLISAILIAIVVSAFVFFRQ